MGSASGEISPEVSIYNWVVEGDAMSGVGDWWGLCKPAWLLSIYQENNEIAIRKFTDNRLSFLEIWTNIYIYYVYVCVFIFNFFRYPLQCIFLGIYGLQFLLSLKRIFFFINIGKLFFKWCLGFGLSFVIFCGLLVHSFVVSLHINIFLVPY